MKYHSPGFSRFLTAFLYMRHLPLQAVLCVCLIASLLAGCGGGSSGSDAVADGSLPQDSTERALSDTSGSGSGDTAVYNLGSTPQAVIDQCMSDADKVMLTQVNNTRAEARSCGSEQYPATTAVSWHCTLEAVADAHSRDMGDHNFFSHTGSDGLGVGDRLTNAGYDWTVAGENIAAGQPTVETVMAGWLDSPGHCANIMDPVYTEFGMVGYVVSGSDYPIYWTQVFARPRL